MEDYSSVIVHRPTQETEKSGALCSGAEEGEEKKHLVHIVCACAATVFVCVRTYTGDVIN